MIDLQLFRLVLYLPNQTKLFHPEGSKAEFLRSVIGSMPHAELRKGHTWHIGNICDIGHAAMYFAFGKTTKIVHPVYDSISGDFMDNDYDTAPYTHVFFDLKYQVLAIAKKSSLAPNAKMIATQLKKLLNKSEMVNSYECKVDVLEILDPNDFINAINSSYSVSRFSIDFGLPNPWDVDKDFHKPLQRYVEAANAVDGSVVLSGDNLNKSCVRDIARSAASTGSKGYADLKNEKDGKRIRSYLQGNPAIVRLTDVVFTIYGDILKRVRSEYEKIRQNNDG